MKTVIVVIAVLIIGMCTLSCEPRLIQHEPHNAANIATAFVEKTVIRVDLPEAIHLASGAELPQSERRARVSRFISEIKSAGAEPDSVWATDYQPMPGTQMMSIYLIGRDKHGELTYYALVMEGTNGRDYKVVEFFFNGTTPFAETPLRKPLF